jgi:Tfp pilus assembly protein PilF
MATSPRTRPLAGAFTYDWDWAGRTEFRRAIDLNPNYETARLWYGLSLTYRGRFEEGATQLQRGHARPRGARVLWNIVVASYLARDYDQAVRRRAPSWN